MDKVRLKNIILAVAHQILSTCSEEKLEMAVAALIYGDPITLKPHKPVVLEDYEFLIQKIERAMRYRPMRRRHPKPQPEEKPSDYPNLFTVTVPMEMDVSKLSDLERQILYQNLDKMLLVTMHPPLKRTKELAKMRAKIGIAVRHLWPEQKQVLGIKEDNIEKSARADIFPITAPWCWSAWPNGHGFIRANPIEGALQKMNEHHSPAFASHLIERKAGEFYKNDVCAISMIFMPIMRHFYKVLNTRIDIFGVPP